jgi:hypothetical protein
MPRVDDDSLGNDRLLLRRIVPAWIIADKGSYRPSSLSFIDRRTYEVSVFVADLTDPDSVLEGHPGISLVAFAVEIPRSAGGIVALTPENPDASHRVLCYPSNSSMRKAAQLIAAGAQWIRFIPPIASLS